MQSSISSEITGSDFFIVLLTNASTREGWVPAETEMAKDSADHAGHPKILPVRLAYPQALPLRLKAAIGHLNHFEWRADTDNEKLLGALLDAISEPQELAGHGVPSTEEPASPRVGSPAASTSSSPRACGAPVGPAKRWRGTTIVPVVRGQETSLSVTRAAGPGFFRVKVLASGALEVAIWSGASYRRVRSQPRKFISMLEGDTHAWCFSRYPPDYSIPLKRPDGRKDPVVVTFDPDLVRAVWMITHQRGALHESFLIVMKHARTA